MCLLRLICHKFRARIFKVKRSHVIHTKHARDWVTVITSDANILMCADMHCHFRGSRRYNYSFVFALLGPANAAVAAAPRGGVCTAACTIDGWLTHN